MTICDSTPHLSTAAPWRGARALAKASICLRPCEEYPLVTTLALVSMLVCLVYANTNSAGGSYIYKQLVMGTMRAERNKALYVLH